MSFGSFVVYLLVSNITEKVIDRFWQNFHERCGMAWGIRDIIFVMIQTELKIQNRKDLIVLPNAHHTTGRDCLKVNRVVYHDHGKTRLNWFDDHLNHILDQWSRWIFWIKRKNLKWMETCTSYGDALFEWFSSMSIVIDQLLRFVFRKCSNIWSIFTVLSVLI